MYEEEIHIGKVLLKQSTLLAHLTLVTLTFSPVNQHDGYVDQV